MTSMRVNRWGRLIAASLGASAILMLGPTGLALAGAQTTLLGYNASTLAVGAQFAFNLPNVVPLPNENLIEEDVPFARANVGQGPVVDMLAAPYYPGDIAANLGGLLAEFGAPSQIPNLNDTLLAHSQYPPSPSTPAHSSFGESPTNTTPLLPSIFYAETDANTDGGDATGTVSNLAIDPLGQSSPLSQATSGVTKVAGAISGATNSSPSTANSLVDVGNISSTTSVTLNASSIADTATSVVDAIDIAGMVDVSDITSTASANSDGTTGTPTSSLHLGKVTVDGQAAYIDNTGVHVSTTSTSSSGITPAQLQQSLNATLAQDGISIQVLNPQLTTNGAAATANAGGLQIAISHEIDVPFIPGEPTIPIPELGNEGLPAGLYDATTSISLGLAQAGVAATGLAAEVSPTLTQPLFPSTTSTSSLPGDFGSTGSGSFGNTGTFTTPGGSVQTLAPTGPGAASPGTSSASPSSATDFPIRGIPPPLGWTIALIIGCLIFCYPLLLLARWQFVAPRRR
jgi:hypothetical protein